MFDLSFFNLFLQLGGVLALILGGAYLTKYFQKKIQSRSTRQLAVTESIRLSQRQALHLIQAGEHYYLVGATDQSLTLITPVELKAEAEALPELAPAATHTPVPDFMSLLAAKLNFKK